MRSWSVHDAKKHFSQVIKLARTVGPQTITRHGQPVVVMVAAEEEFRKVAHSKDTPLEFLRRFNGAGSDLKRQKDLPREF